MCRFEFLPFDRAQKEKSWGFPLVIWLASRVFFAWPVGAPSRKYGSAPQLARQQTAADGNFTVLFRTQTPRSRV